MMSFLWPVAFRPTSTKKAFFCYSARRKQSAHSLISRFQGALKFKLWDQFLCTKYTICSKKILINQLLASVSRSSYTSDFRALQLPKLGFDLTSPISNFLRDLRLQIGMTQLDMARSIGYEQSYISTVELGIKGPSKEFLASLSAELNLAEKDCLAMDQALKASNRRFSLPPDATTATYQFCNDLWSKIGHIHPAVLDAMHSMLKVEDLVTERPRFQPARLRRRDKQETPM